MATTLLSAVNTLLSIIGEAPINSLENLQLSVAAVALNVINEISTEVQSQGWSFNSDYQYRLLPNDDGEIVIPSDVVRIDLEDPSYPGYDVVIRQGKLYDKQTKSFIFSEAVEANIVRVLDFEDIPELCRRWIVIRAGRIFANRTVGADEINAYTSEDEFRARAAWMDSEGVDSDLNMISGDRQYGVLNTYRPSNIYRPIGAGFGISGRTPGQSQGGGGNTSNLSQLLQDYVTLTAFTAALGLKVDTSVLSNYATLATLNAALADINAELAGKADASALSGYLTSADLSSYVTDSELTTALLGKSDTSHNHDSLYYRKTETYTQSEVDAAIADAVTSSGGSGGSGGSGSSGDAYFSAVELLLLGGGTAGSTTIIDSSSAGRIISNPAGLQYSTTQVRGFPTSIRITGGNYLAVPNSSAWNLTTQPGCIELWLYLNSAPVDLGGPNAASTIIGQQITTSLDQHWGVYITLSRNLAIGRFGLNEAASIVQVPLGQWVYIAIDRYIDSTKVYLNRDLVISTDGGVFSNSTNELRIGAVTTGFRALDGYIDGLRFTKGVSRYGPPIPVLPQTFPTS